MCVPFYKSIGKNTDRGTKLNKSKNYMLYNKESEISIYFTTFGFRIGFKGICEICLPKSY